jgi:hypothetical protein
MTRTGYEDGGDEDGGASMKMTYSTRVLPDDGEEFMHALSDRLL